MHDVRKTLTELYGDEEANAEIEMACDNIEYDMEDMSFYSAVLRALDDLSLEHDYAESMANIFDEYIANKE